jgi:UDP-3-O-[3-hydroxymyristoyl] glucosamine N-acyltransferase
MRGKVTLQQLAALLAARFIGDPLYPIDGVNTLEEATESDLSFLANPRYTEAMKRSRAGVICIGTSDPIPEGKNLLVCDDPSTAFQKAARHLLPPPAPSAFSGIHPTAVIDPSVVLGPNVAVGPYAVIDRGCSIGANTQIGPHVAIYPEVSIGPDCLIHAHCTIRERCQLGARVIVQPGAIVGSCGFGYTQDKQGRHNKLEQLGNVVIDDDVEIGANTTIDRSRFRSTRIRRGTKIDNLVQIAHNVEVGPDNIIAAQAGIAGSSKTGCHVMLGGQVGVAGHLELADRVLVGAQSGVSKSLPSGKYRGTPAQEFSTYARQEVSLRRLKGSLERLARLEEKINELFEKLH